MAGGRTVVISNPLDARLADYRNIPDSELVERRGIFIAEGRLVVQRLLAVTGRLKPAPTYRGAGLPDVGAGFSRPFVTRSVMVTETALEGIRADVEMHPDVPVYIVPPSVMNDVAGFHVHRGCLAIGGRPAALGWRELAREARRLLILERIGDPDNVGSLFRHAAAFGADAVLLDPASTDPLYRKAIRTSMGAALAVPFARIDPGLDDGRRGKPDGWPHALGELARDGIAVIALTPASTAPCLRTVASEVSGRRIALLLGHEGEGLTRGALDACTHRARIPMAAGADSINVAAAGAIALYELATLDAI